MPSLDRLAGQLDGKVQLIVVSADIEGRRAVTPYLEKMAFKHLRPYLDKENVLPLGVKAAGLPVTLVYDAEGKEIGRAHVRTPVTNAHLVCRLLLEKKKKKTKNQYNDRQ